MNLKLKGLVAMSIATLVALIGIQGYLIYNTYELKKKTYTIDAKAAIMRIFNTEEVDSMMWLYRNNFLENLQNNEPTKEGRIQLLRQLREITSEINSDFLRIYRKGLAKQEEKYDVKFKIDVTSIELTDKQSGTSELIFTSDGPDSLMLLGENFDQKKEMRINNGTWLDDSGAYNVDFRTSGYMNIQGWEKVMLREMSGVLLLSSLLFLFVVGLLYYSIRNLMKQKKLAEIKTDFINNITHELKTPLSTLSLATNTLSSEFAKGNKEIADGAVKIIERQNIRLQKLIDQVLQSSLGYQQIQLSKEQFNGNIFMNELLDDYIMTIPSVINLNRDIDSTGITMDADKFYLSTAIINILNNAVKYGGTKLFITYGIENENSSHIITIQDNGIGISPKYQKIIFEKFYRVGEKDTHNYKGLGLGLYYTKQIINAHGGIISVESQSNKGCIFTIKIPIV